MVGGIGIWHIAGKDWRRAARSVRRVAQLVQLVPGVLRDSRLGHIMCATDTHDVTSSYPHTIRLSRTHTLQQLLRYSDFAGTPTLRFHPAIILIHRRSVLVWRASLGSFVIPSLGVQFTLQGMEDDSSTTPIPQLTRNARPEYRQGA